MNEPIVGEFYVGRTCEEEQVQVVGIVNDLGVKVIVYKWEGGMYGCSKPDFFWQSFKQAINVGDTLEVYYPGGNFKYEIMAIYKSYGINKYCVRCHTGEFVVDEEAIKKLNILSKNGQVY